MQAYRNFKMKYNSSSGHQSSRSSSLCWRSFRSILYSNFTRNRWFHFSTLAVIFYFLTIHSSPPWIPLFQSKALPNETTSSQSLDTLLLSRAPTNKPDSDLVDPDGSIKPDNKEDRPYPLKVNGKLKQDPRNVPSSAVTPMPILPDDLENIKPLEEEDNADDGNQEDPEQPINEEEDEFINEEVESIKSFEPTKKKGVGSNKKKSSWNDNKFKNQFPFKYSSKNKKVIIDEEQPKEEEEEPAELLFRSEVGDEEQS